MKEIFGKCANAILDIYKNEKKCPQGQINNFVNFIGRDQNVKSIANRFPSRISLSEEMIQLSYKLQILITMEKKYLVGFPNNISKLKKFECPRKVNDEDLKKLVPHFHGLKCLRFYRCKDVTDIGIDYFSKYWPDKTPYLAELMLYDCQSITDTAVANAVSSCSKLKTLFLSGSLLTGASFKHIGEHCQNLKKLVLGISGHLRAKNIIKIENVTDCGILTIAQNCQQLTQLNLNHCINITDEAIKHLADNSKELTRIDIFGCTKVTTEGLIEIFQDETNFPKLKLITLDDSIKKQGERHVRQKTTQKPKIERQRSHNNFLAEFAKRKIEFISVGEEVPSY